MKQEFTTPLFKAKRADGNGWVEGGYHKVSDDVTLIIHRHFNNLAMNTQVDPSTLCMDSGLNAEWYNKGIDPRIWSGDLFEVETRWRTVQTWKVIYKGAAFYAVLGEEDEGIDQLLFDFLSNRVYTKIGSIHENEGK